MVLVVFNIYDLALKLIVLSTFCSGDSSIDSRYPHVVF